MAAGNKHSKLDKTTDTGYEVYLEERKSLVTALLEQTRSFDKYVLTLAGGTFGLSFLFIKQIVPQPMHNILADVNYFIAVKRNQTVSGTGVFRLASFI